MIPESSTEKEKTTTHIVLYRALVKIVKIVRTENDLLFPRNFETRTLWVDFLQVLNLQIFYISIKKSTESIKPLKWVEAVPISNVVKLVTPTVPMVAQEPLVPRKGAFFGRWTNLLLLIYLLALKGGPTFLIFFGTKIQKYIQRRHSRRVKLQCKKSDKSTRTKFIARIRGP
jgi:hypothetical protein